VPADLRATYRVQLHAGFPFSEAAKLAGYVASLGASHLYLSPVLQAAPGSTHGYDVVDPTTVNAELGGDEGFDQLGDALGAAGLGRVIDIVPNHMATGPGNRWWWDVLENGPSSVYAGYFDVDWHPPESKLTNRVLLPVLGDHYGRELEAGRIRLRREGGSLVVTYYANRAPIAPKSMDDLLERAAACLEADAATALGRLAGDLRRLPAASRTDAEGVAERHRGKEAVRSQLEALLAADEEAAGAVDAEIERINGDPDALDVLLSRQNFRLASWRTAAEELDYRRFFDINDLVGVRTEDPAVFGATHQLILEWAASGQVDGLRIDHVDGLRLPGDYLERLANATSGTWVVVEKILEVGEKLPPRWPVAGTTGYDWLAGVGGVLVDPSGYDGLVTGYRDFTGDDEDWDDLVHGAKLEVLNGSLSADLSRLVWRLADICEDHRRYRDYTRRDLRDALGEVLASYPVYRTYVGTAGEGDADDRRVITAAVAAAGSRRPDLDEDLVAFIGRLLAGQEGGRRERELALRAQQLTGAVMAKAVEDTSFYRFVALASANEVGADPSRPAIEPAELHRACEYRQRHHPQGLLATSTHDTKRSEDVRARLAVLTEIPEEWNPAVAAWSSATAAHRSPLVDRRTEWLAYQTVVGAWPVTAERLMAYLEKATREAKLHTSWTDPNPDYDAAVADFAKLLLADGDVAGGLERFAGRLRRPGWMNSLTQKLLTLTGPGVPDLYQGTELWDYSLVDPDNRRPVDYGLRRRLLQRAAGTTAAEAWAAEEGEGLTKLCVVRGALAARAARPDCFGPAGAYRPLLATGEAAGHLVGYVRGEGVAVLATRLPAGLERRGGWGDTCLDLPPGRWRDQLGAGVWEGTVALAAVLAALPVALLTSDDAACEKDAA
jgi:(1->4)-alpha-D-glucan 1-alpha-D-glucosylmutase